MIDDVTRPFPHAVGSEKFVLSCCMQEPERCLGQAMELGIVPGHFYLPSHQVIFETLVSFSGEGREIELVGFVQWLLDHGLLDRAGGPSAVTDVYTYAPSYAHFQIHIRELQGKKILRDQINACTLGIQNAYDAPGDALETLDALERDILAIREQSEATAPSQTLKSSVEKFLADLADKCNGKVPEGGVTTGFDELDQKTSGGMKPGDMFVVAARPSMGKTAFMMNVVEHVALDLEKPTGVFSVEMTQDQLVARVIASRAKINVRDIGPANKPNRGDLQHIQRIAITVAEAKNRLLVDQRENVTINQIRAKARRWKREFGIEFLAIDYLQLLKAPSKQSENSREREVADISKGIKSLAKELKIPIMVLAQLNRGPEGRGGKADGSNTGKPRMSDLRESGSIEQDADMVGLLYRWDYYAQDEDAKQQCAGRAQLDLAKNRNGETGIVPLTFIASLTRFESGTPFIEADYTPKPKGRFDD